MGDWRSAKLTEIAEYINGFAFKPSDFSESGIPIVRIEQLKKPNGYFDYFDGKIPERNCIGNGDLIFSWSASLFLKIWQNNSAYLNQHLFKVIAKEGIDKFFLKYLLEFSIESLLKMSHGSTMQHITRKELKKFEVKLPSEITEQATIATILTTIDQAIEKTEQLIAKYERTKTGLMQDLLTRGIDKQGNIRSEETHEFKDSVLGRIPKEWDAVTIKSQTTSSAFGPRFSGEMYDKYGNVLAVRTTDVDNEGNVSWENVPLALLDSTEFEKHFLQKGDFVITRSGTIGITTIFESANFPVVAGAFMIRYRFKDSLNPYFIKLYFTWDFARKRILEVAEGGVLKNLRGTAFSKLFIPIPSIEEQHRIVLLFQKQLELIKNERYGLQKLHNLKTALMQDLLTGKVRVDSLLGTKTI